ncbi:putative DNA-binding domain-containing protein [Pluralibacter sp.]|uniref:HvfC/BufC family peptide modification chaperone n=1 Tax=Pluralibacter sp. TaxID=1920032 RepID=UPI0025DFA44E|nr:putative DNA-binding domain-containing protein [Pluralibacter sp.]MBV8044569.1 putative DNA-binding domain-containing protein [Pluralibacter sp.]
MSLAPGVPASLAAAQVEFSAQLRASGTADESCSCGMTLYRKIIRENISDVLQTVFPLFCGKRDKSAIFPLVDRFVNQHHATQPEFHQIATELLLFLREKEPLSPYDLALVEYEWLTYAVEIDDGEVPFPQPIKPQTDRLNHVEVIPNPTLKIIALPFRLKEGEPCDEEIPLQHYYAIYRKHNHDIYQKRLHQTDAQLLSELNNQTVAVSLEQLHKHVARCFPELSLHLWLEANNNDELLSLKYRG